MLKALNIIFAVFWLARLILFIFASYTPTRIDIGTAFLMTSLLFIDFALQKKN